jgi:serine/threonine-protein kinase
MGNIFISYSHKDTEYAHRLANNLQNTGLKIWIDERLDYGSQWPQEIQKQLDACDAFIIIMTSRSFASEWVQSELQRAKRKLKPIFPLLLEGDEPWLSVESTQFYDVRGEKLPDEKFYSAIRRVVSVSPNDTTLHYAKEKVSSVLSSVSAKPKINIGIIIGLVGTLVIVVMACGTIIGVPLIRNWLNPSSAPVSSETVIAPSTTDLPTEESVLPLVPSTDIPPVVPDSSDSSMALIPAGEFAMGSDSYNTDEKPAHKIQLDAFYIDKYEVTNALYKTCVDADACLPPENKSSTTRSSYYGNSEFDDFPVIYITWDMANTYCNWRGAHLPTEAQWEKAARGTDGRTYPWGENIDETFANYNFSMGDTTAVGSYESGKSPYGVYDMSGNVWEWVADWYSESYYMDSPLNNPMGPDVGTYRVLRGGSWLNDENVVRAANRGWNQLEYFDHTDFGFRCASDSAP